MDLKSKIRLGRSCARYWLTRQPEPVAIAWLITGRCNQCCTYCMWKHLRQGPELNTDQVKDMVDQMKAAGVVLISLTGGEPLLRDDIGEIIRHIKNRGLVCKLNSNSKLLEQKLDQLRPLDLLQISIDGPPTVHEVLRGEGTAAHIPAAIEMVRREGIPLQVNTSLNKTTIRHLDEILQWGLDQRISMYFQLLSSNFVSQDDLNQFSPSTEDLTGALRRLMAIKADRNDPYRSAIGSSIGAMRYLLDRVENPREYCDSAPVSATMYPDGRLIFCANALEHQAHDAVEIGFAEAFSRLKVPRCQGCECIGRLRISRVFKMDPSVLLEVMGL